MEISESRTRELLQWLDDQAGDHTHLFEQMTRYRDAAALIRQLQAAEQAAWHAGLDAGRERAGAKDVEIEALRAERVLFRGETIELVRQNGEWQARAERLAEALREIEAIEDEMHGGDWDEIEAARKIATAALHPSAAQPGGSDNDR